MPLTSRDIFRALFVFLMMVGSAHAGALPTDPKAMGAWQGSVTMSQVSGSNELLAEVEFAVYAPGQFSTSTALGLPADPSGGADYVYAYEVFNDGPNGSNVTVQTLTINVDYPNFPNAIPIPGSFVSNVAGLDPPGLAPHLSRFVPASGQPKHSVVWNYDSVSGLLNPSPAQHSDILYFASPWAPHFVLSSIGGGVSTGATQPLPSPIPEPATGALAMIATICLLAANIARRRRPL